MSFTVVIIITTFTVIAMVAIIAFIFHNFSVFYTYRAIVSPMVPVFNIAAIAYYALNGTAPIICLFSAIYIVTGPWVTFVYNNFVSIVYIVIAIPCR